MTKPSKPPPKDLKAEGSAAWTEFVSTYDLNPAESVALHQLCQTLDEIADIKGALADSEPMVSGSKGQPVLNPLLAQLVAHRKLVDQLTIALSLPVAGETEGRRRSPQAKQAADTRWRNKGTARKGRIGSVQSIKNEGSA